MSSTDNRIILDASLKKLYLSTIRACYQEEADLARKESLSYESYLQELVVRECEERRHKRITRYLRESRLPLEKNLASFEMDRLPAKLSGFVNSLLEGSFLDRCENILAFGNPGSGKTHLLCAIAQELINKDRRVFFSPCSLLVQNLLVAKKELVLPRFLKKLAKYDAILIDDIGYVQQSREEMEVLFTLLAYCYERNSIMLTSNLPFSQWEKIFKDPMTTAAAIDRLVHHSVILELNLDSYRLEKAKQSLEEN
ncbi:transposase [Desulfomarina profundi]|uniref:Transposase n=1 Tax=Desulfomarina profundi TaxID=2772557 RepID=A0A8D5JS65_9BACT|nr:IS21-like element helper ATPase IstB [Desulfomarina profundi]BCL59469.1 transposase [Desulfomarina profundi]BCL59731.1 transposase [Desulfomarina profundi]BCL61166.1 transposase [Desulfomarina profundi]BCL61776.1 transposase [Desulfomarina profundi]BCL61906.1 transposase [Desulfomarina profundi]